MLGPVFALVSAAASNFAVSRACRSAGVGAEAGQARVDLLSASGSTNIGADFDGRIAQLVEQLTLNQRVHSSSLCAPTIEINGLLRLEGQYEAGRTAAVSWRMWLDRYALKPGLEPVRDRAGAVALITIHAHHCLKALRLLGMTTGAPFRKMSHCPATLADKPGLLALRTSAARGVWCDHRSMTAVELARAADIAPAFLSQIETGKRKGTIDTLRKIAQALSVTLDDLVG